MTKRFYSAATVAIFLFAQMPAASLARGVEADFYDVADFYYGSGQVVVASARMVLPFNGGLRERAGGRARVELGIGLRSHTAADPVNLGAGVDHLGYRIDFSGPGRFLIAGRTIADFERRLGLDDGDGGNSALLAVALVAATALVVWGIVACSESDSAFCQAGDYSDEPEPEPES